MDKWRSHKLPGKLLAIREALGLTEVDLLDRLDAEKGLTEEDISKYETGEIQPPLLVLLAYAKLAGVATDVLIDDRRRLPRKLPATTKC